MHIIIPMSGIGKRFIEGGFSVPKPLIEIDGKPIIQHVVDLFPDESKFTFICNQVHLETTPMRSILKNAAPDGNIISIDLHTLGPVYTVSKIFDLLDDDEEVIVNYCDFSTFWDYQDFLSHTRNREADGVVVCYKGFHPHMLGKTKYATLREEKQWMLEIKEKGSFTNDRMNEYISNGTYYFKKGSLVKKYFNKLMDDGISLNGEYYVSLIYNLLVDDGLKVSIYDVEHMLQWGEPYDFSSYRYYSNYFSSILNHKAEWESQPNSFTIAPIENNKTFAEEGYKNIKSELQVCGIPMAIQSIKQLPVSEETQFLTFDNTQISSNFYKEIKTQNFTSSIKNFKNLHKALDKSFDTSIARNLLISSSDSGVLWDSKRYSSLLEDSSIDVILWVIKGHPSVIAAPSNFTWIKSENNIVKDISLNQSFSEEIDNEFASIGVFTFKNITGLETLISNISELSNDKANFENQCFTIIKKLLTENLNIVTFEVDAATFWKTPGDYETFNYWQSFFHKNKEHPYSLEKDPYVSKEIASKLNQKFTSFKQDYT